MGLALFIMVLVGLSGLGIADESHCRDEDNGLLFNTLIDSAGDHVDLEDGTGAEAGRCLIPDYVTVVGWEGSDSEPFDLTAGSVSAVDVNDYLLPTIYEWKEDGYEITGSLVGRFLPVLAPVMGLLAFFAMIGLAWREYYS